MTEPVWIETKHELPPSGDCVRVKDAAGVEADAIRHTRTNGPDFWMYGESPFRLYDGAPVAWRYFEWKGRDELAKEK